MFATIRQTLDLVGRERKARWVLLVLLALFASGFEMLGAVLVYTLLALAVDPSGAIDLPLVGDLRGLFPAADQQTLLLGVAAAMGVFFLARGVVKVGATHIQARVAHNAGAELSTRLVDGYLRWPYAAHLRRKSSELIRNGHQAVWEVVSQVLLPLIRVGAELVLIIGMLAVLTAIAPAATGLAVLVIGGAAALLLVVVQPRLKKIGRVYHREAQLTLGSLQQSLHGVRDIKLSGRESFFAQIYGTSRARMARASYWRATAGQLPTVVIETALLAFILIFFSFTLLRGGQTQETLSILGLFAYVGMRLQPSLAHVVGGLNSLKYASAPVTDLHADLLATRVTGEVDQCHEPLPFEDRLEFRNVYFKYEGSAIDALSNINLVLSKGQQLGICGPTGGGKTTLVDLLTGLLQPTAGEVSVDGQDLIFHARRWQQNLGVVSQMVFLLDDTLRRNIALGIPTKDIDDVALAEAVELAQLTEFISALPDGLDTKIGERGVRVSGGQRQRIAIARALYRRPSVLVFDEGTSALDNQTEADLMAAIDRLRGDHTIVLIAHRLSTLQEVDQILFIERGSITGSGNYRELLGTHPRFRSMANA